MAQESDRIKPRRVGFIGGHGHHYLRRVVTGPHARDIEVAVSSGFHDEAAVQSLAKALPDARGFDSFEKLFDTFKPDVVSVGTVYGFNNSVILEALKRGIAVVSDKPIATTWAQYEQLIAAVEQTNVPLITEFPFRCENVFHAARESIRQGEMGRVVLVTAQKSYRFGDRPAWYGKRQWYGGTILWVASHAVDVIPYVTGCRYDRVIATQSNVSKPDYPELEDHCELLFELDGGASAMVHADYYRPQMADTHGDDRLRIVGSEGVIDIQQQQCLLTTQTRACRDITNEYPVGDVAVELLAAVTGQRSDRYTTAASLETAKLLLACRDAADRRQWVTLSE